MSTISHNNPMQSKIIAGWPAETVASEKRQKAQNLVLREHRKDLRK